MQRRNLLFSLIFSLGITLVGTYIVLIKPPTHRIAMELRNAQVFIEPTVENVQEGYFQTSVEDAFSDQFIKRSIFIEMYYRFEHFLYNLSLPNKEDYTLVKIGNDVFTFPVNEDYLTGYPLIKNEGQKKGVERFIDHVNEMAEAHPNLHFYVFKPFRINESNWFDEDNGFTSYGQIYRNMMIEGFSDKVIYSDNQPETFEEYKEEYYKTDPHWNAYGTFEGYKDILKMFENHYGEMVPYEPVSEFCFENFNFYGQYGRNSAYLTSCDKFCDLNYDLPEYKTYVNGKEERYDRKEEFKNNQMEEFYWNYIYSVYHGNDEAEVIFETNQNTGRNLLVFVDSYSSPIKHLIAAHFDKTYYIDPRINPGFDFESYLVENEITDVMWMGFYGSLYTDESYIFDDEKGE